MRTIDQSDAHISTRSEEDFIRYMYSFVLRGNLGHCVCVDGASIMRMTVQSLKDLIRSSPESKHLGVIARKEMLQSRALAFLTPMLLVSAALMSEND